MDSDGRLLFDDLHTKFEEGGMIQYGITAFGFDENGELSGDVHHKVIRNIAFPQDKPGLGQALLTAALQDLDDGSRIYAFFHYFGMSAGACREFAAIVDGREIGWGQVHFLPQGDIAYLRWIYIDGSCQHRGYGSRVMRALLAQLYAMGIRRFDTDTALDNLAAQGYYEKTGFRREGITRSYYR